MTGDQRGIWGVNSRPRWGNVRDLQFLIRADIFIFPDLFVRYIYVHIIVFNETRFHGQHHLNIIIVSRVSHQQHQHHHFRRLDKWRAALPTQPVIAIRCLMLTIS